MRKQHRHECERYSDGFLVDLYVPWLTVGCVLNLPKHHDIREDGGGGVAVHLGLLQGVT